MAEPISRSVVAVQDWPGLVSNNGPTSSGNPGEADGQTNLRVNVPGEMSIRPGFRKVQFDEE